ncbi:MAG: hypothetical protein WBQ73_02735 [Candidatus Babeliales bacterium]
MNTFIYTPLFCLSFLLLGASTTISCAQESIIIDQIAAIIIAHGNEEVITWSSIHRPPLDGRKKTLEDLIDKVLILEEGKYNYGICPTKEMEQQALNDIMKQNNLTKEQLVTIVTQAGYTLEEAQHELVEYMLVQTILQYVFKPKLEITSEDIQSYYNEHPLYEKPYYVIRQGTLPLPLESEEKNNVKKQIMSDPKDTLKWGPAIRIELDLLDQHKKTLLDTTTPENPYSDIFEENNQLVLLHVIEKHNETVIPIEKRVQEITLALQKNRHTKLLDDYKHTLRERAVIIRF